MYLRKDSIFLEFRMHLARKNNTKPWIFRRNDKVGKPTLSFDPSSETSSESDVDARTWISSDGSDLSNFFLLSSSFNCLNLLF